MNFLLIILGFILLWRVIEGFRNGMVKEIISFISLIVMAAAVILLGSALSSYFDKQIVRMIVAIILFLVLCIAHRIISVVFFSAKMLSKLPVIHTLDRLMGGIIGILETIIMVWVMYSLIMNFGFGIIGEQIMVYVKESNILTILYEYNYLAKWMNVLLENVSVLPFLSTKSA